MAIVVLSLLASSLTTGLKSADLVSGYNQNVGAGTISLYALSSATGMTHTLAINGVPLVDDQPIPWFGTTGTMKKLDNEILTQRIAGGRVTYNLRNPTGGTLTADVLITFTPGK